ncbi:glycosyltransferase [Dyadobacter frigoris]|uniref:Glycosyltransferase n=1 Tax=Dyadobacter frigoris TaxID=2576211 RepID=A0A4U6D341_9BACT|nr:glycosyltransferase [Dyadobacter frigoris]TKT90597.1 glycosyltransferase [Dyadobacter frigoris]GLU51254.1 hypothetical protein Dfri01_07150 [Dyadobacter frigoris]
MGQRVKTFVILSPGFPKDENDSTCISPQQQFVQGLKLKFPNLNIIVLAFQYPFFKSEYNWNGVKVIAFGGESKSKMFRLAIWIKVWRTLLRLNEQYEIVGLLSFWLGECAFVSDLFSKYKKLKHYCWLLGQDARAGNKYVKWIRPEGRDLIALSDFLVREFERNYSIKPKHIIPVGIMPALFQSAAKDRNITILGAGSLIKLKQYELFVEVVKILKPEFPYLKTMICGDGPELERLKMLCKESNLEDVLSLPGELPHSKVLGLMQRSQIFLHTSAYEGFGAVCLEALYAGAGVISFVKPMNEEIPNWHIVDNVDDMASEVRDILNNPRKTSEPVMPYEISKNAEKMMELFNYKEPAI